MALAPLAAADDLAARGITVPAGMDADVLLDSASAAVRDAAGCAISRLTSTVTLVGDDWCSLDLPFGPVASVADVTVAGSPVTGWALLGDSLQLPAGWTQCVPAAVTVTYTHGLGEVPSDIVDLVCGMVAIASAPQGGYGATRLLASAKQGNSAFTLARPAGTDTPSPMSLPDSVRERLRARFGSSVALIGMS